MLKNYPKDLAKIPAVKDLVNETAETVGGGRSGIDLYEDINFGGRRVNFTYGTPALWLNNFNDKLSSFVVNSGKWKLYKDTFFRKQVGGTFKRGVYDWVEKYNVPNDSVSSLRRTIF